MSFYHGNACNLPSNLGQFGCVLAANLVCRLPNPYQFLDRLSSLVAPGGTLVITSPYSWFEQYTPKVCRNINFDHKHIIYLVVLVEVEEGAVSEIHVVAKTASWPSQ